LNESIIFKLLLLLNKKEELLGALNLIRSNPHRILTDYENYKNLEEISYIDSNVIVDIAQNPERLYKTSNGVICYQKKRYSPSTVLQYEVEETLDTLENRFIKHFLEELDFILSDDLKEFIFLQNLEDIKIEVEDIIQSGIFSKIGELNYFPLNSQVLMKRAGYREIFQIYRLLHLSFIPGIFTDLDTAFSLKFRPDFLIEYKGRRYIFDAKFRVFEDYKSDILKNMHYYRDGLKLNAAIAVSLSETLTKEIQEVFLYPVYKNESRNNLNSFSEIVNSVDFEGIGNINLNFEKFLL